MAHARRASTLHNGAVDRTQDEFRESSAAALAHAMTERAPVRRVLPDETVVDADVIVEAVPVKKTVRYRERPRFNS